MTTRTTHIAFWSLVLLMIAFGAWAYPMLPDQIASHWNIAGEADGFMGKFWGVLLFPLMTAGIGLLFALIPKIDPLKKNIEGFRKTYNIFWFSVGLFMAYMFTLSLVWNLGTPFDFSLAIIPAFAVFFYGIGVILERSKRNWFMGIRTPWTLSSDTVWEKTHLLGAKLFKIAGIASLLGLLFEGGWRFVALMVPLACAALIPIIYSYVLYRREETDNTQ